MSNSTLRSIAILVRLRWQIARNSWWRGGVGRKLSWLLLAAFAVLAVGGVFWLSGVTVEGLQNPDFRAFLEQARRDGVTGIPADLDQVLESLPSLLFFSALLLLLFTSFGSLLSTLYLSGDMDLLLAAPLPMRAVFVVKFFEALLSQYLILFLLLGPALLGFGRGMGYGLGFAVVGVLLLALVPLLPAGLAALLVMAVVRVLPARRARDIVGVLGGLLGATIYIVNQLAPELAPQVGNVETLGRLLQLDLPLLPSAWAGRALVAAGEGDYLTLLVYGGLFVVASLLVFGSCLVLSERLYYGGWANLANAGGSVRRRQPAGSRAAGLPPFFARALGGLLSPAGLAVLLKDLRIFPRDLRSLQQLIFPIALAAIWTFRLLSNPPERAELPASLVALTSLTSAGIAFFVCLTISNTLAGTGISAEGRAFWLLRLAPITSWQLLRSKLLLAYLPFLLLGAPLLLLLLVLQGSGLAGFVRNMALLLLLGLGVTAISLGFGAAFPKFDWDNPQKMWSFRTGCLAPIFYLGYIALTLLAAVGLPLLAELEALRGWSLALRSAGWLLALLLTILACWLPLSFGARRLERIEL